VVGLVEAWRRKPSVADCERLPDDTQTLRGFWHNPVTRILIIASLSGIGAFIGFVVGVTWFVSVL
jgi:pheromone shutdown protein TraB